MEITTLHTLSFKEILNYIEEHYQSNLSAFKNGELQNSEDENQGSAKTLFFAQLNNLSKEDTLKLFAEHYQSVLEDLNGTSHQNIRNFMKHGWDGVVFENEVLKAK